MDEVAAKKLDRASLDEQKKAIALELITKWEARYGDITPDTVTGITNFAGRENFWIDDELEGTAWGVKKAQEALDTARAKLTEAIRLADLSGMPETQIAYRTKAHRLTVRRALGK